MTTDSPPTPYGRQSISPEDIEVVAQQLISDWLTTGPAVEMFESSLSEITGGHSVVAVSSGTAALHCAYATIGLQNGDEIITSPLTFVATAATAIQVGAKPIFVDVTAATGNLDAEKLVEAISPRTKAITAIDYAGNPADYRLLRQIASEHGLFLISDASHSLGASLDGRPVGDWADITTLSFFPTKNITTGEGGAVVCRDSKIAQKIRLFRNHGLVKARQSLENNDEGPWHQEVHTLGLNYRLTDIQAALGLSQLGRLGDFRAKRSHLVDLYNTLLGQTPVLTIPGVTQGATPFWHLYPLRVPIEKRLALFRLLHSRGIRVQVNYLPTYWHPYFVQLGYRRGLCPIAEDFYRSELSLPLFADLDPKIVHQTCAILTDFLRV